MSYAPMVNDNLIEKLGDVSISSLSNGQVLQYNDSTDKWENGTVSAGGGGGASNLDDLGDVSITNATSGHLLIRDATNFKNRGLVESDIPTLNQSKVGLGNVNNTSDADKPISTATQTALDLKAPINSPTFTGTVGGLDKSMVGLGNVDNTRDYEKPISLSTQNALDLKAPINSPTFTGTVGGIDKSMVGLGNVDNTSDADKPISTATQTALNGKQDNLTFDDNPTTNSSNPVKSGGVKTALDLKQDNITNTTVLTLQDLTVNNTLHTSDLNITRRLNVSNLLPNLYVNVTSSSLTLELDNNSYATYAITGGGILTTLSTLTLQDLNTYGTQIIIRIQGHSPTITLPTNITINKTTTAESPTTTEMTYLTDISSDVTITSSDACLLFIYVANANNVFLTHKLFT